MKSHKNVILLILSAIFIIYAGILSLYPALLTSIFNIDKFEQKVYDSTSLVTTIDDVYFKMKANLKLVITIRNWSSKYIDDQDCFDAGKIEITTNPFSVFTKNFKIKNMYLRNVKYSNQILPTGENKLEFLPEAFNSELFGTKKITIEPGPIKIKRFRVTNISPDSYSVNYKMTEEYSAQTVKDFLSNYYFSHVKIK